VSMQPNCPWQWSSSSLPLGTTPLNGDSSALDRVTMGRGETLQLVSFVLLCTSAVLALVSAIFGFWGNRLADRSYWDTIKLLTTHVEAARTRQQPQWTPFVKVDARALVPPNASFARLQFKLWSDDNTIPLMIRVASTADGSVMNEVAGPSGVVEQMMIEKQTFYVSFSHPKLRYEVSVLGYKMD